MAAVDLLRVQPDVALVSLARGEFVVLAVVAPDEDPQTRRRAEHARLRLPLEARLLPAALADIAAVRQLRADVVEILLALGLRQLLQDALEVLQLRAAASKKAKSTLPLLLELLKAFVVLTALLSALTAMLLFCLTTNWNRSEHVSSGRLRVNCVPNAS